MKYVIEGCTHQGIVDVGAECCPHEVTGTVLSSQSKVTSDGKAIAVDGTPVAVSDNPHTSIGYIVASNGKVIVNGKKSAMIGDTVDYNGMGTGTIISGSTKVSKGG